MPLPAELENANQQFSGLYIANNNLYLLPECRLQDKQEAAIYSIPLSSLDAVLSKTDSALTYKKIPIEGMEVLREKIHDANQVYEGTEAMVISGSSVYISLETNTPSPDCYLMKGKLTGDRIVMDTSLVFALRKPTKADDEHIYNAGFEAVMLRNKQLYCFFEYNNFSAGNYVYLVDSSLRKNSIDSIAIQELPFRITDISAGDANTATAINYFYKGDGGDEVYRPAENSEAYKLVHDSSGFFNYNRLVKLHFEKNKIFWSVIGVMPSQFWSYNWEGIAEYKNGYFMINDKYTDKKPYKSVLLYVKPL